MPDSSPHKHPVTREGIALLIEDCEKTSAALSVRPTPFQLEQAVNFLVATVPAALRNLVEQLEASQKTLRDLWDWVGSEQRFSPLEVERQVVAALAPNPASGPPVSSRGGTPLVSSSVPPVPNQESRPE